MSGEQWIDVSADHAIFHKGFRRKFEFKHFLFSESAILNGEKIRIEHVFILKILKNIKVGSFDYT